MRLFVAIYPPEEALDHLSAAVARTRLGAATAAGGTVGLTARERWHLTLAFLGDVGEEQADTAAAALGEAVARWRADGGEPPSLRLAGAGRFGRRRFTVVWVGLAGDIPVLRALGQQVRRQLRHRGLPYDGKPLRPHLTLARPGTRLATEELATDMETLGGYDGPSWMPVAVQLVRSRLGPNPVHETLHTVPLV